MTAELPQGSCTLVGAGPGDPELLTLKAHKALQRATVLLVDDLVSDAVVACANHRARIIHVGKRSGCTTTPQSFVEKLMITAVREGEQVVRLKGGDPCMFGRSGEEIQHLREAGIEVAVINGIPLGLAAATAMGTPLTYRADAQGLLVITEHARAGGRAPDWSQLASTAYTEHLTLLVHMRAENLKKIQHGLMQGLPAQTPAALVQSASLPAQRHVLSALDDLHTTALQNEISGRCVMIVGEVLRGLQSLENIGPALACHA